uniref:Uncharacterized protein n=1 Tax=Tanacetum cinerariifolium TaxID=118510 RepID=A0A699RUL4_TANCI|nr:hypothetical protein [Tanacetum cinerariifolium]
MNTADRAKRYGARATGAALGIKSIWNSTGGAGGRPGKFSGNTLGKSWTIGTSLTCFLLGLSSSRTLEHGVTVNRDSLSM